MKYSLTSLIALLEEQGGARYGQEPVSQLEHALQCAQLAAYSGARGHVIAAALFHDVGHLLNAEEGGPEDLRDQLHEASGAYWLSNWFGPEVTEPVRLHVAAKRYLCFAEPGYWDSLSDTSKFSLELQGGVLDRTAAKVFIAGPHAEDAVRLRRWDDLAKRRGWPTIHLASYRPLLEKLCGESVAA